MFTLLTRLAPRELFLQQAPVFLASLVIAELFYKFHSFLLETGAFLGTWFILDGIVSAVWRAFIPRETGGAGT